MDKQVRQFESGANRDMAEGKFQTTKFVNPLNDHSFFAYMHSKRTLADGTLRDGDNWQKGIPMNAIIESLDRHNRDLVALHQGLYVYKVRDDNGEHTVVSQEPIKKYEKFAVGKEETCNGIRFNTEAYKLQTLGYKLKSND